jgi:MFS family permease
MLLVWAPAGEPHENRFEGPVGARSNDFPVRPGTVSRSRPYAGYSVGVLVATPLCGYLGDRIGYRRLMLSAVVLSAGALALIDLAPHLHLLLLGRLSQDAAAAASWTAGLSLIAEHCP